MFTIINCCKMKYCVILIFFGLFAQMGASGLKKKKSLDSDDGNRDSMEGESARLHSRRRSLVDDNKVLAFGLDTGAPDSKNGLVQAITDAFGGMLKPQHSRSNAKGDEKKPLGLELKSESLLRSLENFLASPKVKRFTRDLARKAALVYRSIEKDL